MNGCKSDKGGGSGANDSYSISGHADSLLFSIQDLREQNDLCDITICAEGRDFRLHKVIIAAGSPYFRAMFTNTHRESFENTITLNGIDAATLDLLFNFIYSSSLQVHEENVQNLLAGANLLQLTPVVKACCKFLQARICPENSLGIAAFADLHGCTDLYKSAWSYALENFAEIVQEGDEFLQMPAELLIELLKSQDLVVHSEEEVLGWVIRWYRHDETLRCTDIMKVLDQVKFPLIPWQYLQDTLMQVESLGAHSDCQTMLTSVKLFQTTQERRSVSAQDTDHAYYPLNHAHFTPRPSIGRNKFVYAVGGEASPGRTTVNSVERYNPTRDKWELLSPMLACRRGVGVGIIDGLLYAVGGSDGARALRLVERYDPRANSWVRIADMNEKRSSVAVAVLGKLLYALGGYDGVTNCLRSVERYNPQTDTWQCVAEMTVPRSMACACAVGERLFMVGGYNGVSDLQSCELYDPTADHWTVVEGMEKRRCMAGVAVMEGLVYVVGGCDQAVGLRSAEMYDPASGKWGELAEMREGRSGVGVAVVGRKLYAIGGHTGSGRGFCSSAERYDMEKNSWTPVASMTVSRKRFGCCS